ncbi:MFS transporter [Serratia ficaria]|uniref:MFS transporter n=1 Tax=Serratia ficaria TaxID=61651 RepID=UPI00218389AD|nr:MFS transporter [Serratia ficaria]CAI2494789.1 D-galactonate transporter [Serratia ficaria]
MKKMRWIMVSLCFLAIAISYIDRANLAVAAPDIQRDLNIGPAEMGLLLSGFFWTYAFMQMPAGWLIDKIGSRLALPLAVGWWSAATILSAGANSIAAMFGCRLLLGVGESGAYPACSKIVSQWFSPARRAFATSIYDSGARVGSAISIPLVALIVSTLGWRMAFIIAASLGFIWVIGWFVIYREPTKEESVDSPAANTDLTMDVGEKITWGSLFKYRTLWGMMIGFFCFNLANYFFITWFPAFLMQAHGFSLKDLGTLGMLPALAAIPAGWLGGFVSDALYRRGWSLTAARKTCLVGGMIMSSAITLSAFTSNIYAMLGFLSLSYGSLAFTGASVWSLPGDVAPSNRHVASIAGIQNFASNLAGIVITTFTGVMVQLTQGSFAIPLMLAGGACLLGAFSYLVIVGKIEPLHTNNKIGIKEAVHQTT